MATQLEKIALALEMLESAESSVRSARQILHDITGGKVPSTDKISHVLTDLNAPKTEGEDKIIEGVFDGEKMMGKDQNEYPIPANYASKSKLVAGDVLKLTIKHDGSFVYKQIAPIPRKHIMGTLTYDGGKYKVLANGKVYSVLLASVTYYRGEAGDRVSLIVPEAGDTDWGAIDSIIPSAEAEMIESA